VLQLQTLRIALGIEHRAAVDAAQKATTLEAENSRLKYQILHLKRALDAACPQ